MTASRIRRSPRISPSSWSTAGAASATARSFRPDPCGRRCWRRSPAPTRSWWWAKRGRAPAPGRGAPGPHGLPVLPGRLVPDPAVVATLAARAALAFAGIADPEKFFTTLRDPGIALGATQAFPDHPRFAAAEADDLITRAKHGGLALVTTEKDLARLQGDAAPAALAPRATALPVTLGFEDADAIG